jgi:hypothetical protein
MTWIVAVPIPFGYAKGCADIRVTFKNGREKTAFRKSIRSARSFALLSLGPCWSACGRSVGNSSQSDNVRVARHLGTTVADRSACVITGIPGIET